MPIADSPELTDSSTTLLPSYTVPLALSPASQSRVASSPSRSRTAATIAWKSAPVGENEIIPAYSGSARSMIDVGSSASVTRLVL